MKEVIQSTTTTVELGGKKQTYQESCFFRALRSDSVAIANVSCISNRGAQMLLRECDCYRESRDFNCTATIAHKQRHSRTLCVAFDGECTTKHSVIIIHTRNIIASAFCPDSVCLAASLEHNKSKLFTQTHTQTLNLCPVMYKYSTACLPYNV